MEGRLLVVLLLPMTSATQLAEEPQVARGGGGLLRGGGGLEHSFLPIEAQYDIIYLPLFFAENFLF